MKDVFENTSYQLKTFELTNGIYNNYSLGYSMIDFTYGGNSYFTDQLYNNNFPGQGKTYNTFGFGVAASLGGASATQEYYSNIKRIW